MLTPEDFPRFQAKMAERVKAAFQNGRFIVLLHIPENRDLEALAARYPRNASTEEARVSASFQTPEEVISFIVTGDKEPRPVQYMIRDLARTIAFPGRRSFCSWKRLSESEFLSFMNELSADRIEREFFRMFIHENSLAGIEKSKLARAKENQ